MDFQARAYIFYYVQASFNLCVPEYFYQQEVIWIQTEGMGRKTQWQTWTQIKYASVLTMKDYPPLFIHTLAIACLWVVLFPVPKLWACSWDLFWPVEWARSGPVNWFWDKTLRHLTDFLLPSSDFAIFAAYRELYSDCLAAWAPE